MAAPNQPGSVLDFVVNLSTMMINPKDLDRDARTCSICAEAFVDGPGDHKPIKLSCGQ